MATHDFFAKITQISDFFAFPNFRKVGKFVASIKRLKTISASASEGKDPLTRGSALGPCWGLCPQTLLPRPPSFPLAFPLSRAQSAVSVGLRISIY